MIATVKRETRRWTMTRVNENSYMPFFILLNHW